MKRPTTSTFKEPKVYIVLLNWNGWKDTIECLESVLRSDYPNFSVIVCDNASSDESVKYIEKWASGDILSHQSTIPEIQKNTSPPINKPVTIERIEHNPHAVTVVKERLTIIETGANLGFAGGNNVGIKHALADEDCSFVWLLNNDTVVEKETLSKMIDHSLDLSEQGIANTCGSLVCFYDAPDTIQSLGGGTHNPLTGIGRTSCGRYLSRKENIDHQEIAKSLTYIHGCSWLLPRAFLAEIGLMEENYFLYYEELDWCTRSQDRYALTYAHEATVYHKEGRAIGSRRYNSGPSVTSDFYMSRARRKFMKKFYPNRTLIVLLTLALQAANRARKGKFQNSFAILKAIFTSR